MWPFSTTSNERKRGELPSPVDTEESTLTQSSTDHSEDLQQDVQSDAVKDEAEKPYSITGHAGQRLGIHPLVRFPVAGVAFFTCGFALGAAQGGPVAAYRYRAENAHRLPTTGTGWFLYQKSKNYHTIVGSMKEGAKFGCVCTGWASLFMLAEEGIDRARGRLFASYDEDVAPGQRDAANTVMAATGVAGLYSWRWGLDKFAVARTAQIAVKYSLLFGLMQDATATLRGNPPAYIEWVRRQIFGSTRAPITT